MPSILKQSLFASLPTEIKIPLPETQSAAHIILEWLENDPNSNGIYAGKRIHESWVLRFSDDVTATVFKMKFG